MFVCFNPAFGCQTSINLYVMPLLGPLWMFGLFPPTLTSYEKCAENLEFLFARSMHK